MDLGVEEKTVVHRLKSPVRDVDFDMPVPSGEKQQPGNSQDMDVEGNNEAEDAAAATSDFSQAEDTEQEEDYENSEDEEDDAEQDESDNGESTEDEGGEEDDYSEDQMAQKSIQKSKQSRSVSGNNKKKRKVESDNDSEGNEGDESAMQDIKPNGNGKVSKSSSQKQDKKVNQNNKVSKSNKKLKTQSDAEESTQSPSKKRKQKDEDQQEVYKWWEEQDHDNEIKWTTLEHKGPQFPPDYVPHGVLMRYDGQPVKLSPPSEEIAGFFAQLLGTQYVENETFCKNFFTDFLECLKENDPKCPIMEFELCDFTPMKEHFDRLKEEKKLMTKEQKNEIKLQKKAIDDEYGFAFLDGRKEKVGNFRIEPPGLFRGRGEHPKTGMVKKRVMPEQITINIGKDAKVPDPPAGHQWGAIVHDNTVAWLANWTENITGGIKYVRFSDQSSLKGISDFKKFEKARQLKDRIDEIRKEYTEQLRDKLMVTRQRATVIWLIDKLALRAGNEKGEDEADTVGCCSLRFEHIALEEDEEMIPDPERPGEMKKHVKKMVVFDFLGKDSVRYYNRVEVDPIIWKNLKIFKRPPKREGDPIFDRLSTSLVNAHLSKLMPGLTAKVFRTYNASHTFQIELEDTPEDATVAEKILAYNRANRQVAILCNHQRAVSKNHSTQMEKLREKLLMLKYQRLNCKQQMIEMNAKLKKSRPELTEPESDLDEETYARKEKEAAELEQQKLEKKYESLCEKAKAAGEDPPAKEDVMSSASQKKDPTMDRLEKQYKSLSNKILTLKSQLIDRDENKTTALGTSKINYIDPRITAAWAKKHDVPIEKMFTKTLRQKFTWAMDVDADWEF
ncbi:hypothetical protein MIR68_005296 [Amoeboaphelidium protococcarum]|nr:hypothetical protein MIR68_005296 [Amoeboaphelidium protococcarum]